MVLRFGVALAILCVAAMSFGNLATTINADALGVAFSATPWWRIVLSLLAAAASFGGLAAYERCATSAATPGRVPVRLALGVGAVSHAIANTLGFHVLTGAVPRYAAYRGVGLSAADVARVMTLVGIYAGLGAVALLAVSLLMPPAANAWGRTGGLVLASALLGLMVLLPSASRLVRHRWPTVPRLARTDIAQATVVGLVESGAAVFSLFILLPDGLVPGFAGIVPLFLGAILLGLLSHSPGGLGVFEVTIVAAFAVSDKPAILAALLLYRLLYNIVPFGIALTVIVAWRLRRLVTVRFPMKH